MKKNIIICSDGTGNTSIKGRGTNVYKIYEAIVLHEEAARGQSGADAPRQFPVYDDGVGTESSKPVSLITGAFGIGVRKNVIRLYLELARIYNPGDDIFLFGFSRGAFTVRSLCGLITEFGIPDPHRMPPGLRLQDMTEVAYRVFNYDNRRPLQKFLDYFRPHQKLIERLLPEKDKGSIGKRFRNEYGKAGSKGAGSGQADHDIPVRFIGVWDTVSAIGFPFPGISWFIDLFIYRYKFPDNILNAGVAKACQALAIDDERGTFHPILWDESLETDRGKPLGQRRIEQVWFPGVHTNVGGGYPKQGMSLISLDWMMQRAEDQGLPLHPARS